MPILRTRHLAALGALGLAAVVASAGPAGAVDAAKPAPCTGAPLLTDPAGDQNLSPLFPLGSETQPPNTDIKSLFFNYRPDKDGKPVLTANIQVANLDKTIPAATDSQGGLYWYVIYAYAGQVKFVAAHNSDGATIDYEFGTIDPDIGTYTTDGTTTGQFFEGPDGIVQIDVPEAVGGKPGETLGGALVTIDGIDIGTDHGNGINNHADTAPDDADVLAPNGKDYIVAACPGGAAPPPPSGGGGTPPPPPPSGGGGTPPPPPSGGGTSEPTVLPVTLPRSLGKASKAKKGRTLKVKVKAEQPVSGFKLTLKKRSGKGATLASGKARSLKAGTSTVKMKVRRKLKKGVYALLASGKVDGRTLRVGQRTGLR